MKQCISSKWTDGEGDKKLNEMLIKHFLHDRYQSNTEQSNQTNNDNW